MNFMMSEEQQKQKSVKIKLEVDEKLAGGDYANLVLVNHSDSEFVLDGFFIQPQKPVARHCTRSVMSPRAAKRLLLLLQDRINNDT